MRGKDGILAAATLGIVMLLGISGVIAALGDTLFPARSFAEAKSGCRLAGAPSLEGVLQ